MAKPYVILSPNYDLTSGGIKVMFGLYGYLLSRGVEVYMNQRPQKDVIAIYPEIQNGNPVQTDKVVRYVLNTPGKMGGIDIDGKFTAGPTNFTDEKVYYFSRMFGDTDDNHYMFLPIINLRDFYDKGNKRTKTCYLVGKGTNRFKHPNDSIELNRTIASDQSLLNDILNTCHTFYCYDDLTAMMEVARLSGTKVKYYGDLDLAKYEPGLNGINSKLDVKAFRLHYVSMIKEFERKLDLFITDTQKW